MESDFSTEDDLFVYFIGFLAIRITKFIGMDCEMVGVGSDGDQSVLARVSIVNRFGQPILDEYGMFYLSSSWEGALCCTTFILFKPHRLVRPTDRVTDFRTHVSGIMRKHLFEGRLQIISCLLKYKCTIYDGHNGRYRPCSSVSAKPFKDVQKRVADILEGRTLVGHGLKNDMKVPAECDLFLPLY